MTQTPQSEREKWNQRYLSVDRTQPSVAAEVLLNHSYLLPSQGRALDLACGLGGNALLLSRHGLETYAWDFSDVAIAQLRRTAQSFQLTVYADVINVAEHNFEISAFDVIVVTRFLDRRIVPALIQALRHGGLIFYQTFIRDKDPAFGPTNPEFLLAENELLHLFAELRILVYREEGRVGDVTQGMRNEAMLVAMKRGRM